MKKFRSLSLSSQIFFLISSFVLLLILIQYIVYSAVFQNYYINTIKSNIDAPLEEYIEELRENATDNYFKTMYDFRTKNNSISIMLDSELRPLESEFSLYSIEVINTSTYETYFIILPEPINSIKEKSFVIAQALPRGDTSEYDAYNLKVNGEELLSREGCTECVELKGSVQKIQSPKNLNNYYTNNQVAVSELLRIEKLELDLSEAVEGISIDNNTEFSRNIVYIHQINDESYVLTIYVVESPDNLSSIIGTYNLSIYAMMIAVSIIISILVSNLISKPIKNIDDVAKEISELNFDAQAVEFKNQETASLSRSINKISVNMKENINQLQNRNDEILNLYEQQSKQVNLRKKFISAISHELKTPLMVINITAQGILDGIFKEHETDTELTRILAEITNLDVMIKDLLDVYKLDELNIKEDLEKVNLRSLTLSTIESLSNLTRSYNQVINVEADRNTVIYGDAKFISMVVSNLITNAIKYSPNNENIEIAITSVKDKITFKVTNYGAHIPKEALEHIWEPFYRVDESRTKSSKAKGTGLGLYIVSETLKAHGFDYGIKNIENGVQAWFTATKNKK